MTRLSVRVPSPPRARLYERGEERAKNKKKGFASG